MKQILAATAAMAFVIGAGAGALADGMESAGKPTVIRFASAADSGVTVSTEHGVKVYRGAPVQRRAFDLVGAPATKALIVRKEVVIEHHYHPKIRRLRTQGFYSGHSGKSRRFTQGFYSGPVDRGRR